MLEPISTRVDADDNVREALAEAIAVLVSVGGWLRFVRVKYWCVCQ